MAITNGNFVDSPIPNTTMLERLRDGKLYRYVITPDSGYVLHDKEADICLENVEIYSEETGEIEIVNKTIPGFKSGSTLCTAEYDFKENPRGFYAILRSETEGGVVI